MNNDKIEENDFADVPLLVGAKIASYLDIPKDIVSFASSNKKNLKYVKADLRGDPNKKGAVKQYIEQCKIEEKNYVDLSFLDIPSLFLMPNDSQLQASSEKIIRFYNFTPYGNHFGGKGYQANRFTFTFYCYGPLSQKLVEHKFDNKFNDYNINTKLSTTKVNKEYRKERNVLGHVGLSAQDINLFLLLMNDASIQIYNKSVIKNLTSKPVGELIFNYKNFVFACRKNEKIYPDNKKINNLIIQLLQTWIKNKIYNDNYFNDDSEPRTAIDGLQAKYWTGKIIASAVIAGLLAVAIVTTAVLTGGASAALAIILLPTLNVVAPLLSGGAAAGLCFFSLKKKDEKHKDVVEAGYRVLQSMK